MKYDKEQHKKVRKLHSAIKSSLRNKFRLKEF